MNQVIRITFFLFLFGASAFSCSAQFENTNLGYGAKLGINYSLSGAEHQDYMGSVMPSLGMFMSVHMSDQLMLVGEPGYSAITFRKKSSDTKYNFNYVDLSLYSYFYPSPRSKDFAFIIGVRPSFLIAHSTEVFRTGSYQSVNDPDNNNKNGRLDIGASVGISLALSPVVEVEVLGNYSMTNNSTLGTISGRPSTIEVGVRLNAVNIKSYLQKQQTLTRELVQHYSKGVLLVMLPTTNPSEMRDLKSKGRQDEINMIENELRLRNTKVIKEFTSGFTFCPVYFFMDTSAYKVVSGNLKGIFVNSKLEIDPAIDIDTTHFFVASFCEDVSSYTKRRNYGLYVYNNEMVQLGKPFNHPNQLAPTVYDYAILKAPDRNTQAPAYFLVPFNKLIGKFNSRLLRYLY